MPEVTIVADDGGRFSGYLALPARTPAPGVVVIQEIFGVNEVMRGIADWLAAEGYVALSPDLFWRIEPGIQISDKTEAEWQRAFELFNAFDVERGVSDLKATALYLRQHEATSGKVASIGYCLGGKLAFLMATRSDCDCNVSYYGVGLDALLGELDRITKPLLMHVAAKDQFVPPEARAKILEAVKGHPQIALHLYEGQDHAFARQGGAHYDRAAAELANRRSLDFLKKNLA